MACKIIGCCLYDCCIVGEGCCRGNECLDILRKVIQGMILVLDFVLFHLDQPHAVWVISEPAANGRGHHQLEVLVPASCIAVVMAAENLSYASRVKLLEHFFSLLHLDVKVLLVLIGSLQKPWNVLEHDGVNGAEVFRFRQMSINPSILFVGQFLSKSNIKIGDLCLNDNELNQWQMG